jgi:hypothetical protein
MITPGVEQMYGTCRFAAKANSPLYRMDRVGLAGVRSARLPSSQSQRLALAYAVCLRQRHPLANDLPAHFVIYHLGTFDDL